MRSFIAVAQLLRVRLCLTFEAKISVFKRG